MSELAEAVLKIKKLDSSCVMNVRMKVTQRFKARVFIAILLLKIASWILGCGLDVKKDDKFISSL